MSVRSGPRELNVLAIRRQLNRDGKVWGPPQVAAHPLAIDTGWAFVHRDGNASILLSVAPFDGADWVHASMTAADRTPTYEELKHLHRAVFGAGWAYQVFAPPTEHVNIHVHALHLWGRLDGQPALPNFAPGGTI